MTREGWRALVVDAMQRFHGMGWLDLVAEVPRVAR
jgi:hypothetical protein